MGKDFFLSFRPQFCFLTSNIKVKLLTTELEVLFFSFAEQMSILTSSSSQIIEMAAARLSEHLLLQKKCEMMKQLDTTSSLRCCLFDVSPSPVVFKT